MTTAMIDTERLKRGVDLRDLAGRLVVLRPETSGGRELSGPCPKCGGVDRFHVKEDMAFCRQCWPLERTIPPHDAIGFVQWAGLARDFRAAVDYLGGRAWPSPTGPRRAPEAKLAAAGWQAQDWQDAARRELRAAQDRLASPAGDPGAQYLLSRGLLPETWQAWGLGYGDAWDPKLQQSRPAILIPWQRGRITAIKYRFLTVPEGGLRYSSRAGGQCLAFGLNMAGQHWSTLWVIEGELNALSLWQALRADYCVNYDVISFGSDAKAAHLDPAVKAWAGRYQQVIVWADDPDKVLDAMQALPKTYGLFGLRSPVIEGRKYDANAMLLQPGALASFALAAWNNFDRDLEYIGRVEAAIKAAPGLATEAAA